MTFSMKGSGIYSEDISLAVECPECNYDWEQDFITDDYGNVEDTVKCPSCDHGFTFTYDKEDSEYWDSVDDAYDNYAGK